MKYKIEWSDEAYSSLEKISDYLKDNWNKEVLKAFYDRIDGLLQQIAESPESGAMSLS